MLKITTIKQTKGPGMNFSTLTKYFLQTISLFCLLSTYAIANTPAPQSGASNAIKSVQYSTLPGSRLQISLEMTEQAVNPLSFTIDNPARIAFDFPNTASELP